MGSRRLRAYGQVRSILLALATLAIVGVLFGVYQYSAPAPQTATRATDPTGSPAESARHDGAAVDPDRPMIDIGRNVASSGGQLPKYVSYDPDTREVRFEIYAAKWQPSASKPDTFEFVEPVIRARTSEGQWIRVSADRLELEIKRMGGEDLGASGGRLDGQVRVEIDRLGDAERQQLPDEQRRHPDKARLIVIETEHLLFDLSDSTLRTIGPFTVIGADMQIASNDLMLQYNEVDSRIERLETAGGGTIRLAGAFGLMELPLQGSAVNTSDSATATSEFATTESAVPTERSVLARDTAAIPVRSDERRATAATPSDSEVTVSRPIDPDGVVVIEVEEIVDEERRFDTYLARFTETVRVEQSDAAGLAAHIGADVLELAFEFGLEQRQAARTGRLAGGPDSNPAAEIAEPTSDADLMVTWAGPLAIEWKGTVTRDAADPGRSHLHIEATGNPVVVDNRSWHIRCGSVSYDNETQRVRVERAIDAPLEIRTENGSRLIGERVEFDQVTGRGEVTGPGMLIQGEEVIASSNASDSLDGEQGVSIRFGRRLGFAMGRYSFVETDGLTGERRVVERRFIESAEFEGAVRLARPDGTVETERATVRFRRPEGNAKRLTTIEHFAADGHVEMTHGSDGITCEGGLDIIMGTDPAGRTTPRSVVALDSVVVMHEGRRIAARQRMQFEFRSVEETKEPFDLALAHEKAMALGMDPATVDWEKQRIAYERGSSFRPVLTRLQAMGGVVVNDPSRELVIRTDRLDSGFDDQGEIEWALLTGSAQQAFVRMGELEIVGQVLDLNMPDQHVRVPGQGMMRFSALTGLDGRRLDQPADMTITWKDQMEYSGLRNSATFQGGVEAISRRRRTSAATTSAMTDSVLRRFALRAGTELLLPHPVATGVSQAIHPNGITSDFLQLVQPRSLSPDHETIEESTFNCARRLVIDFADSQPVEQHDQFSQPWGLLAPLVELFARSSGATRTGFSFDKEPVSLLADGGVTLTTATMDAETGLIGTRNTITTTQIYVDLHTQVMQIEHAGSLLIENYVASTTNTPDARPVLFASSTSGGPSQTFVTWNDSAQLYYGSGRAEFNGADLVHLTGSRMLVVRPASATELDPSTQRTSRDSGRRAHLACDRLIFEFSVGGAPVDAKRGAGQMAINELSRFEARGHVLFEFRQRTVVAETITYEQQSQLLSIVGSELMPASIHEARGLVTGEKFTWNMETDERKLVNYTTMRY